MNKKKIEEEIIVLTLNMTLLKSFAFYFFGLGYYLGAHHTPDNKHNF